MTLKRPDEAHSARCTIRRGREEGLQKLRLRVLSSPHRKHVVFSGASVLADIMKDQEVSGSAARSGEQDPQQALKKCMQL